MFVDTVRIESADMKNILFLFHEEPNTRSLQLPHIPVTAFSQTDLFLVWIIFTSDPHRNLKNQLPELHSQVKLHKLSMD